MRGEIIRKGVIGFAARCGAIRSPLDTEAVLCPLTGRLHRLFWMRSAWWCHDCRQKIETCCEGGC
jgi:hypothetical protein